MRVTPSVKKGEKTKPSYRSSCNTAPFVMMVVACSEVAENWGAETVCVMKMGVTRAKAVKPHSRPTGSLLNRDPLLPAFVLVSVFLRCRSKRGRKNRLRKTPIQRRPVTIGTSLFEG